MGSIIKEGKKKRWNRSIKKVTVDEYYICYVQKRKFKKTSTQHK
jgi:hypothetical protein